MIHGAFHKLYIVGLFGKHLLSMGEKLNSVFLIKVYIENCTKLTKFFKCISYKPRTWSYNHNLNFKQILLDSAQAMSRFPHIFPNGFRF